MMVNTWLMMVNDDDQLIWYNDNYIDIFLNKFFLSLSLYIYIYIYIYMINYDDDMGVSIVMGISKMVGLCHGKSHLQMDDD